MPPLRASRRACSPGLTLSYLLALCAACGAETTSQPPDAALPEPSCDELRCAENEHCVIEDQVAVCSCVSGFMANEGRCVPEDPCATVACGAHGRCEVRGDRGSCACEPGYLLTSGACVLDSACADLGCHGRATCQIDKGSRECVCNAGFVGNGRQCMDQNGCASAPCFPGVTCEDVPAPASGHRCGACPPGYTGDGTTCTQLDDCAESPCFEGVTCTDLPPPSVGHSCGACPDGFVGDGTICAQPLEFPRFAATVRAACALRDDGTARCATIPRLPDAPRYTASPSRYFRALSAGHDHICVLNYNSTPSCWPTKDSPYRIPQALPNSSSLSQVAVGYDVVCGILSNTKAIRCWTFAGETAEAPNGDGYLQLVVNDAPDRARAVCGLRPDGSVRCAGVAAPSATDFTKVTANAGRFCGVHQDAAMSCWGPTPSGTLEPAAQYLEVAGPYALKRDGTLDHYSGPLAGIVFSHIVADAAGSFVCGHKPDGRVECDGVLMPYLDEKFRQIVAASGGVPYVCGTRGSASAEYGPVVCWGNRDERAAATAPPEDMVFAQLSGNCGLRRNGRLVCWDEAGLHVGTQGPFIQAVDSPWGMVLLGFDGHVEWHYSFDQASSSGSSGEVPDEARGPYVQISGGPHEVCGLRADGSATCFTFIPRGSCVTNSNGGSDDCWTVQPVRVPAEERFTRIDSRPYHFCGLHEDGTMLCIENPEGRGEQTSKTLEGQWRSAAFSGGLSCPLDASGNTPCKAPEDGVSYTELDDSGFEEMCGLTPRGRVQCWTRSVPRSQPATAFDLPAP